VSPIHAKARKGVNHYGNCVESGTNHSSPWSNRKPVNVAALLAPGGVEDLVKAGRVPAVIRLQAPEEMAICLIPPRGTQFGDRSVQGGGCGGHDYGVAVFRAPNGKRRGVARTYSITAEQAGQLAARIDATLKALGR
jgi:hypothetical protein